MRFGEVNRNEVTRLDIMLERILSLIPKKPNGSFEYGALKQFANTIGLKSGNLISDWLNGRSKSYSNYIYEISSKYHVSVEWLQGKTDIKDPTAPEECGWKQEAIRLLEALSPEELERELAYLRELERKAKRDGSV